METLYELYQTHTGFVSDKWESYLYCYQDLLAPWRDREINMLEVGIQNGGSLEIWSRYFRNAKTLIGCDINPNCSRLKYADPRISLVIGDCNEPAIRQQIFDIQSDFDLIIDDGSHRTSDIVKSFATYFPHVKDGGLYIVEDLHCGYWQEFEGGLFDPTSSISFFKIMVDAINFGFWRVEAPRPAIYENFRAKYGVIVTEELLSAVHSVAFYNSICVVRKKPPAENVLGHRVFAGKIESVARLPRA